MTRTRRINAIQSNRFDGITRHKHRTANQKQSETGKKDQGFKSILDLAVKKLNSK